MTIRYIGLDFESSGSDPWGKHVPIQIGMAVEVKGYTYEFADYIGGWSWAEFEWNEEAAKVHNISTLTLATAHPVWAVDIMAASWLIKWLGIGKRMWNVTVGWNVAGFDRQFVTRWMPNLNRLLSYRTIDLNALVFAQAKTEADYTRLKSAAKTYADSFNPGGKRHDALVDAMAALQERRYLVGEGPTE